MRPHIVAIAVLVAIALGTAGPATAQGSALASVIEQLEAQGFQIEDVERTWLGRTRVVSRSDRHRRELVFNPRTGEVLRDYWQDLRQARERDDRQISIGGGSDRERDGDRDDDDD